MADPTGFLRQLQAVADDVGDAVVDLRGLVIVGEDDGVLVLLQPVDLEDQRGEERPFDLGNLVPDPLEDLGSGLFDGSGEFEIEAVCKDGACLFERGHGVDQLNHTALPNGSVARRLRDEPESFQ